MQTIVFKSLNDEDNSHFKIITYPDGQHTILLDLGSLDIKKMVEIQCRIKNWCDMEILMCIIAALRKNDFHVNRLEFTYLFGQRSDRVFAPGEPNYFKEIVGGLISNWDIDRISIVQPHNKIVTKYVNASSDESIMASMLREFDNGSDKFYIGGDRSIIGMTEFIFFMDEQIAFEKHRTLTNIRVSLSNEVREKVMALDPLIPIIIYDDLCDGGATFIAEAEYLRNLDVKNPLYLCVVHGLFRNGFTELFKHFDRIYTTNSYSDIKSYEDRLFVKEII